MTLSALPGSVMLIAPIAVAEALLFGPVALEAGVAGGRDDHGAGADQMVAGLADRRLTAGETVDVVRQRQRQVDAVHHRIRAVAI